MNTSKFSADMAQQGFNIGTVIADGKIHRFDIGKPHDKAGWYVLYNHSDIAVGIAGNWKTDEQIKWCSKAEQSMTDAERKECRQRIAEAKKQRDEDRQCQWDAARVEATKIWDTAKPAPANHPYLKKKGIDPYFARIEKDYLLIPAMDAKGIIHSLQQIYPDGIKKFLYDGKIQGHSAVIKGTGDSFFIAEGFATAASVHAATARTVYIAFNAGNLPRVAEVVRKLHPNSEIIIAADNDHKTEGNPGITKGRKAAEAIRAKLVYPSFPDGSSGTDWNDYAAIYGLDETAEQIAIQTTNARPSTPATEAGKPKPTTQNIFEAINSMAVNEEYTSTLGAEQWLFPNLIIKNQITTIIAKSGGGKTTINFEYVSPWIIRKHGITVHYLDCDSPASDHKRMFERAKENGAGFTWINPIAHGKSATDILALLREGIKSRERFGDKLLIFDTLKKFVNVMDKRDVKAFYELLRQLIALGATIVLLGHANKYRDNAGNLIFEGVGDVVSDTDALIFFERIQAVHGVDITTIVDPDKGAKVRGIYQPITFHIDPDRTVTQAQGVIPLPDYSPKKERKKSIEETEEICREYLLSKNFPVAQKILLDHLIQNEGLSNRVARENLRNIAVPEGDATYAGQIVFKVGEFNRRKYTVFMQ